jgi:hypothetical protein
MPDPHHAPWELDGGLWGVQLSGTVTRQLGPRGQLDACWHLGDGVPRRVAGQVRELVKSLWWPARPGRLWHAIGGLLTAECAVRNRGAGSADLTVTFAPALVTNVIGKGADRPKAATLSGVTAVPAGAETCDLVGNVHEAHRVTAEYLLLTGGV